MPSKQEKNQRPAFHWDEQLEKAANKVKDIMKQERQEVEEAYGKT